MNIIISNLDTVNIDMQAEPLAYECIVLDLDDTLIFSSSKKKEGSTDAVRISFPDMHGDPMQLWVHKRPGFVEFLQRCFATAAVGVWSMGQPGYVEAVTALFPQKPAFIYNWCHCDRAQGRIFKRLDRIPYPGRVLMIDDRPDSLELCDRVQTVIVQKWHPSIVKDTTLHDLGIKLFG